MSALHVLADPTSRPAVSQHLGILVDGAVLAVRPDGTFRIQFERTLRHPVAAVWAALTDPAKLSVWMPGCRLDARIGGEVVYDFGEEGAATGTVTGLRAPSETDAGAELTHSWIWDNVPTSRVTWRLEPVDGGTRLLLTHAEVAREPARDFAVGWHLILDLLDRYCAGHSWDDAWDDAGSIGEHYARA